MVIPTKNQTVIPDIAVLQTDVKHLSIDIKDIDVKLEKHINQHFSVWLWLGTNVLILINLIATIYLMKGH